MNDIFDLLIAKKEISECTEAIVRKYCQTWKCSGYHGLLETHTFEENGLADRLAEYFQIDRVYSIYSNQAAKEYREKIPVYLAKEWEVFVSLVDKDSHAIEIVIADPSQRKRMKDLQSKFSMKVHFSLASQSDVLKAIDEFYSIDEILPFLKNEHEKQ